MRTLRDDLTDYAARARKRNADYDRAMWFAVKRLKKAESDLELGFLMIFVNRHLSLINQGWITYAGQRFPWVGEADPTKAKIDVEAQAKIGRDRIDFLLTVDHPRGRQVRFAVECDGHAWHDRTKEQASRDRARDRRLLRQGVITLRFTFDDLMVNTTKSLDDLFETMKVFTRAAQPPQGDDK